MLVHLAGPPGLNPAGHVELGEQLRGSRGVPVRVLVRLVRLVRPWPGLVRVVVHLSRTVVHLVCHGSSRGASAEPKPHSAARSRSAANDSTAAAPATVSNPPT